MVVLYIFSGVKRRNSVAWFLRKLARKHGLVIEVIELDLRYSKRADFTVPNVQSRWLRTIDSGVVDAPLVTPPCSTFSRAPWANERGPYPLRSSTCLRGFTWNSPSRKRKAMQGNSLADFSFEAMRRQLRAHPSKTAFMEQPEDLGATKQQRVPGHRPGSMWQFSQHFAVLEMDSVRSVALAQVDFGSESVKPTRLLLRCLGDIHPEMYEGVPILDANGYYLGPLPRKTGVPLIGRQNGVFRTAASAQWPPALCEWVATKMVDTFLQNRASKGTVPQPIPLPLEEEKQDGGDLAEKGDDVDPFHPPFPGGHGRARSCVWKGREVPFHDGGCLLSPGRWDANKRSYPDDGRWNDFRKRLRTCVVEAAGGESELEKECFRMAKGEKGCKLVQSEALRGRILGEVQAFCGGSPGVLEVADGQPFRLCAMRRILEEAGDGDCQFLAEAETGFPLGVKHPLPRTPAAFERQVSWSLKDDPTVECVLEKANYPSAGEHEAHLRNHLEAEVQEGLVEKMPLAEFRERYGSDRAIAALAVLVEDEVTGKKRVIHDGSHDVRVNHRIKCLDKLRMPGGREKIYLLTRFREAKDVVVSLIGDFGKAHRRFKYREDERGFLGCMVSREDGVVYVNKVGTFGITSTPYWWGRLSGSLLRICHYLLGPGIPIELLLYADDLEAMGVGSEGRKGAVLAFIYMAAFGSPFKWSKQRGGSALNGLVSLQTTGITPSVFQPGGLTGWWRG